MSLKLSLALITAAGVGGSLLTAMSERSPAAPMPAQSALSANARQSRVGSSPSLADPAAVAEQIRTAQIKRDDVPTASTLAPTPAPVQQAAPVQPQPAPQLQSQGQAPMPVAPFAAPAQGSAATGSASTQTVEPDLTALRYFATRGDTARLQAEIARLRSLYPNWTPPADPLAIPVNRDQQLDTMWKLYSDGRYAEVRRAIADRQSSEAGWLPPQDLLNRLDVAESRARLTNASDLKQYATVIALAAATPSLLNCSDVDVLWRVAEAFTKTDRAQRGVDAYKYILQNCTDPQQRIATVQKAAALLPYDSFSPLLAFEQNGEFALMRDDFSRRFVAEANEKPGTNASPDDLARLKTLTDKDQKPADMLLLGWYALRHSDMTEAEKWFRAARQKEDTASASQGLSLVLINRNASTEAEDVMYRWRNDSEESGAVYLAATANLLAGDPPPAVSDTVLQRVATTILDKKYVPTAQELGWYARAFGQPQTAARWFETALQWKPDDEPSAYGLAITRQQLNDRAGVMEIQRAWAGRSDRIANLGMLTARTGTGAQRGAPAMAAQQPMQQAPVAAPVQQDYAAAPVQQNYAQQAYPQQGYPQQNYVAPQAAQPRRVVQQPARAARPQSRGCSATDSAAGLPPQEALNRAWCLMDLNRPLEAAEAFEVALSGPNVKLREDAAYGQSLAYLRLGLTSKAAVAATRAPQRQDRSAELQVAILSDRANAAYNSGRYREALLYLDQRALLQPETADLMVLRGYALMNLGKPRDAVQIFEAVAATGNREGIRGLANARDAVN